MKYGSMELWSKKPPKEILFYGTMVETPPNEIWFYGTMVEKTTEGDIGMWSGVCFLTYLGLNLSNR